MDSLNPSDEGDDELADEAGPAYAHVLGEEYDDEKPVCVRLSEFIRQRCQPLPVIVPPPGKPSILYIEDDRFVADDYANYLRRAGFAVYIADSPERAFCSAEVYRQFDAVVLDIRMPPGLLCGQRASGGGTRTGLVFAEDLINYLPDSVFIALTNSTDPFVTEWFSEFGDRHFHYCWKHEYPPKLFAKFVHNQVMNPHLHLKAFIVHGHDREALLDLKNYLQNRLGFPAPIVLQEQPSGGRTIIEKFEDCAADIDVAFVLLTPDDMVDQGTGKTGRARQNVIFELGYFVGKFGRRSGRVILLGKKGLEMLSDLSGVVYIDISNGIEAAGENIRRELERLA